MSKRSIVVLAARRGAVIYEGGAHVVRCDGRRHYTVPDDGGRIRVEPCWCAPARGDEEREVAVARREFAALRHEVEESAGETGLLFAGL